jgi:hypothetical protein
MEDIILHATDTLNLDLSLEEVENIINERSLSIQEYLNEVGWELISEALEIK